MNEPKIIVIVMKACVHFNRNRLLGDGMTEYEADQAWEQLNRGNPWAWCFIIVRANDGFGFSGSSSADCCSFRDEEHFIASDKFLDLQKKAISELSKVKQLDR